MSTTIQSAELRQVSAQARAIARETTQVLSSAHVLLALFTVPNLAAAILLERGIDEQYLLSRIEKIEREPDDSMRQLANRASLLAKEYGDRTVNPVHVLAAMTRMARSFGCRLMDRASLDLIELRRACLAVIVEDVPSHLERRTPTSALRAAADESPGDTAEMQALDMEYAVVEAARDTATFTGMRTAIVETGDQRDRGPDRRRVSGRRAIDESDGEPSGEDSSEASAGAVAFSSGAGLEKLPESTPTPFILNRERFRWLSQLGRNLSHLAYLGRLDPVLGREREIEQCVDVLNKRRSNNPCLVGDPGVGKTAVAEGVALSLVSQQLARHENVETLVPDRVIIQIDVGSILAGTHLRGSLAERLRGLQDEVKEADGAVVVFIDEIHTIVGAGGGDGGHDASNELKSALARGQFPCIGATTVDEYRKYIEADPALERRFTPVHIEEPDVATTVLILKGVVERYAAHHGVTYTDEAVDAAVRLGRRYLHERRDPDRALGLLDLAGAVARRERRVVDRRAVAEVVSRAARVPIDHLVVDEPRRYLNMENELARRIVGQEAALAALGQSIRRNLAGFSGKRPIGSFLFLGPSGVGKTEVVKAVAEFLFGHADSVLRFDMSEFLEQHSVARLIGAPPGYVGHGDGGQLTEAVRRRPYQVVLFDEIEKGHRDVWNLLLQLLDEGRVTDGRGRTVDFSNTVVILTSNLGADVFTGGNERRIGFGEAEGPGEHQRLEARVLDRARRTFPPELWNRIEDRLVFHPLNEAQIRDIARLIAAERSALLASERGITFELTDAAIGLLLKRGGFDPQLGARPMRQTLSREVEARLAERILSGVFTRGAHVIVDADGGELTLTVPTV